MWSLQVRPKFQSGFVSNVQVAPSPGLRTRSLSATLGNAGIMMEDSPSLLHGKTETTAASQHPMQKTRRKRTKVWCQWRPFMNFYVRCVPWTALDAVLNSGCWGLGAISLSPSLPLCGLLLMINQTFMETIRSYVRKELSSNYIVLPMSILKPAARPT